MKAVREKAAAIRQKLSQGEKPTQQEIKQLSNLAKTAAKAKTKELAQYQKQGSDTLQYIVALGAWLNRQNTAINCLDQIQTQPAPKPKPGPAFGLDDFFTAECDITALVEPEPENNAIFDDVWTLVHQCYEDYKKQEQGIIPRCVWDRDNGLPYTPADLAFCCGIIDGGLEMGKGVFDLVKFLDCFNPMSVRVWLGSECTDTRSQTYAILKSIATTFKDKEAFKKALGSTLNSMGAYFDQTAGLDNQARYNQGKALFNIASLLIGVSEVNALLKGQATLLQVLKASVQSYAKLPATIGRLAAKGMERSALKTGAFISFVAGSKEGYLAFKLASTEIKLATLTENQLLADIKWAQGSGAIVEDLGTNKYINQAGKQTQGRLSIIKDDNGQLGIKIVWGGLI